MKVVYKITGRDKKTRNPVGLVSTAEKRPMAAPLGDNDKSERVQNRCMMGRTGWMNLHSLCPAREYTETVHVIRPRRLRSMGVVSRRSGHSENDKYAP